MTLYGIEFITKLHERGAGFDAKMVLNANGAIFFQGSLEHRSMRADGISYKDSYKDNYKGNAMAAMLRPGRIEIRYHERFSVTAVRAIIAEICREPAMTFMTDWQVTYQGRPL